MFELFSTLVRGANARANERATDHFAIDLIQQRIREADAGVEAAKRTLASLIMRQRQEKRSLTQLQARKTNLEERARAALADNKEDLARDAAEAIADLENEETVRTETLARLNDRISRMQLSVEKAHRRVIDLRQSALAAEAIDMERKSQKRLNRSISQSSAIHEAEKLIKRVTERDDPFEETEVLDEIEQSLTHEDVAERLANAGYGDKGKSSADDVLARLRSTD